eukprot:6714439-Prymnesium_polylepis.1
MGSSRSTSSSSRPSSSLLLDQDSTRRRCACWRRTGPWWTGPATPSSMSWPKSSRRRVFSTSYTRTKIPTGVLWLPPRGPAGGPGCVAAQGRGAGGGPAVRPAGSGGSAGAR